MNKLAGTRAQGAPRWKVQALVLLLVSAGLLLFMGANAHLVYVAVDSQPDCVPHLKTGHDQAGAFSAADSAC